MVRLAVDEEHRKAELKATLEILYEEYGIQIYFAKWLKENEHNGTYQRLTHAQLSLKEMAEEAGHLAERESYEGIRQYKVWDAAAVDAIATELVEEYDVIPSCEWLRENGYADFVGHMTKSTARPVETLAQLRERYGVNQNSQFISRDGANWNSFAEACFANFLFARGITFRMGERYPDEYSIQTGYKYGKYDIHFTALVGDFAGKCINVEIFGCPRNFCAKESYEAVRRAKEKYHQGDPLFMSVEYSVCYSETALITCLAPYIGVIEPYVFKNATDAKVPSTSWSIKDRTLKLCQEISDKMPDKTLPSNAWMLCVSNCKDRERDAWELSYRWNTLVRHIRLLGGPFNIRTLLGQNGGRRKWSREQLVEALQGFYETYNKTPSNYESVMRKNVEKGHIKTDAEKDVMRTAANLQKVCQKHGGYSSIRQEAGLPSR